MAENITFKDGKTQPSNQITVYKNDHVTLAFYDTLVPAHDYQYAQLHAKGEYSLNGRKQDSKIAITLQDRTRSNDSAKNSIEPEKLQFLLTRLTAGFRDVELQDGPKIFGDPDSSGLSMVRIMSISRHEFDQNGKPMKNPWTIRIQNGRGKRMQNRNGGGYMASGSFKAEIDVSAHLTDEDMFILLKRIDSYINEWEAMTAEELIPKGRKAYSDYRNAYRSSNNVQNGNRYQNQNYQTPEYYNDRYQDTQYRQDTGNRDGQETGFVNAPDQDQGAEQGYPQGFTNAPDTLPF